MAVRGRRGDARVRGVEEKRVRLSLVVGGGLEGKGKGVWGEKGGGKMVVMGWERMGKEGV
jgi:hypothetical protein